jgi:hypothetical protein
MRLPAQAARQLPDQSTTLRVDSSSTDDSRLRGALPQPDSCTPQQTASLFDHLSATASSVGGIARPSALAVFMLMLSTSLVGNSTGKSGRLGALQNLIDEVGRPAVALEIIDLVADEPPGLDIRVLTADCRQSHGRRHFRYAA